jgi:hypothetical protein
VSESNLYEDNDTILVNYYQWSLNPEILQAVWRLRPSPVSLAGWMHVAQNEDNQMKHLAWFTRTAVWPVNQVKKPFFYQVKKKMVEKNIWNTKVCEAEEADDTIEDNEEEIDKNEPNLDLCILGSNLGACFNCNELGHFSRDCKKPWKKPKGIFKQSKYNKLKKVENVVKILWALDIDGRKLFLEALNQEGFWWQTPQSLVQSLKPCW